MAAIGYETHPFGVLLWPDIAAALICTGEATVEPGAGEHTVTPTTAALHAPEPDDALEPFWECPSGPPRGNTDKIVPEAVLPSRETC